MNGAVQHMPLEASERASFHGDPTISNALELASVGTPAPQIGRGPPPHAGNDQGVQNRIQEEFVVVNLEDPLPVCRVAVRKGEGSDLKKKLKLKYGSFNDDMELGQRIGEGKHVNNGFKDDAADGEAVCRVCHLGLNTGGSESIELGCACKQDLALCHRDCAEEWFKIRGNTVCEICGETVKNVKIPEPVESTAARLEADGAEADTQRIVVRATAMSRLRYLWQKQLVRNLLLASLIVIFMVPWFFRIAYFTA